MIKRIITTLIITLFTTSAAVSQNALNNAADNIVGTYSGQLGSDNFKAKITKMADGSYRGQIIWMENDRDAQGNKRLDTKNPDKKLRSVACDRIVLFSGLRYDSKQREWNGTKIYDPKRGMRAKMVASWTGDGRLKLHCSVLGISKDLYWERIEK